MKHSFKASLKRSNLTKELVNSIYTNIGKLFKQPLQRTVFVEDLISQKKGIDRIAWFYHNGQARVYKFEEKIVEHAYEYMCFELYNIYTNGTKTPGWGFKELECDFLFFYQRKPKLIYLMPWKKASAYILSNIKQWLEEGTAKKTSSENEGYVTHNALIPWDKLQTVCVKIINK